jgi:hypothetical protein
MNSSLGKEPDVPAALPSEYIWFKTVDTLEKSSAGEFRQIFVAIR